VKTTSGIPNSTLESKLRSRGGGEYVKGKASGTAKDRLVRAPGRGGAFREGTTKKFVKKTGR